MRTYHRRRRRERLDDHGTRLGFRADFIQHALLHDDKRGFT
jgi:hypothetical protein